MSAADIIALILEFAEAFGVVEKDAQSWLDMNHPELAAAPTPDEEEKINADMDQRIDTNFAGSKNPS